MRFPEFAKNDDWLSLKIYEVCKITTGTFDANAMSNSGKFPFFTCAKEVYRIDKYTFDAEALLVSGNGANVGYIHYCNGKFSAYQRTYVLWDFNINIFFVKYFLEGFLKARISKERRDGNTPYIVLDTLRKFNLYAPKLEEQSKIANFLSLIDKRIELQNKIIRDYELLKKGIKNEVFNKLPKKDKWNFLEILTPFLEFNNSDYPQYTIGKQGMLPLPIDRQKYNKKHHIVFRENMCIFGIGIYEVGVSIDTIGCCSPIYKVYSINNSILNTNYFREFINYYLAKNIMKITKKSTRREFEIDTNELVKLNFYIPDLITQKKISEIVNSVSIYLELNLKTLKKLFDLKKYLLAKLFI